MQIKMSGYVFFPLFFQDSTCFCSYELDCWCLTSIQMISWYSEKNSIRGSANSFWGIYSNMRPFRRQEKLPVIYNNLTPWTRDSICPYLSHPSIWLEYWSCLTPSEAQMFGVETPSSLFSRHRLSHLNSIMLINCHSRWYWQNNEGEMSYGSCR